ncbi:hypothetical protein GCM10029976_049320 [Kribbella albertanoniae]
MVTSCFALVGCSPGIAGELGLMRDDKGNISAVLQICEGHIEYVALNLQGPGITNSPGEGPDLLGEWESDSEVGKGFVQFDLAHGGNGWKVVTPLAARNPASTFSITSWSMDNTWTALGPQFKTSDLANLKPGEVMVMPDDGSLGNRVQTLDDFKRSCS